MKSDIANHAAILEIHQSSHSLILNSLSCHIDKEVPQRCFPEVGEVLSRVFPD